MHGSSTARPRPDRSPRRIDLVDVALLLLPLLCMVAAFIVANLLSE
jgi:hypothetical protein